MTETFTSTPNLTANSLAEQDNIGTLEPEELNFYDSIRADLDLIESNPNDVTIQNILDHSLSLR